MMVVIGVVILHSVITLRMYSYLEAATATKIVTVS